MKLAVIGDFHGVFPNKLKSQILKEKPDYILCIGDYSENDEYRKLVFKHWEELKEKPLNKIIDKKVYNKLVNQRKNSFEKMLNIIDKIGIKVFSVTGNGESIEKFTIKDLKNTFAKFENIDLVYNKIVDLEDWKIMGICSYRGASSKLKDFKGLKRWAKISYLNAKWDRILRKLFLKMGDPKKAIFFAHEPPYNTKLDLISNAQSPLDGKHLGDEYFRKYIEKYQPALMVCGHFHENQGTDKLGKTLIVNCGSAKDNEAAIIDIGKSIKVKFIKNLKK
jgi:Icc-related predicted phosphoesterase